MGLSFTGATFEDIVNGIELIAVGIEEGAKEAVEELIRMGEESVLNTVTLKRTRQTGALQDSVGSQMVGETVGEFGYIKQTAATGSGEREGYAFPQEYGFTHYKSGKWIEGMFALRDAAIEIEDKAPEVVGREIDRRIRWRG